MTSGTSTVPAGGARLPIIYVRGYGGARGGIDLVADDPYYGLNLGSTHIHALATPPPPSVSSPSAPATAADEPTATEPGSATFYAFEGPLLRLIEQEGYHAPLYGDQRLWLSTQGDGTVDPNRIFIHRFYDSAADTFDQPVVDFSLVAAARDLHRLVELVRSKTGAARVVLVAHSMGGLICRCLLQQVLPDAAPATTDPDADPAQRLDAAQDVVARMFTYATPHGGIDFTVVPALTRFARDLGFAQTDVFGPAEMHEYLSPTDPSLRTELAARSERLLGPDASFSGTRMLHGIDPTDLFCLIGTDARDYDVAHGASRWAVGPHSDGLVQISNAQVVGSPRAFVHRSHSGRYGIVNSEEGYLNLQRFLFGDVRADLTLAGLASTGGDVDLQLEVSVGIRGYPVNLYEQTVAHMCPIAFTPADGAFHLLTTYLSSDAPRPSGSDTLRYYLTFRLYARRARPVVRMLGFRELAPVWSGDTLIVDVEVPTAGGAPAVRAQWYEPSREHSEPDPPARGEPESLTIALPAAGRAALGEDAQLVIVGVSR